MTVEFEHCIRCTICVENCSVFKVDKDFPGPKQAGPDAARFRLFEEEPVDSWVNRCSQCKRCNVACPYGVNPAEIIQKAQLRYSESHIKNFAGTLFGYNYYLGILGSAFAPVSNWITSRKSLKLLLGLLGISTYIRFPKFFFRSLSLSWRWKGKGQKKVVFFHGCYLNSNAPDLGRAMRDVLVSMGVKVVIPRQVCCGLPTLANGNMPGARRFAKKNTSILTQYVNRGYDVIYACPSCGLTLTRDYPGILNMAGGKRIAENTYNLHEYILSLIETGHIKPAFREMKKTIAYHIPCHLRAMGIGNPAVKILRMIPGIKLHIMDDHCCGLSGSYGFKRKYENTSIRIGEIAAEAIMQLNPDILISDCGACRMQLEHFTNLKTIDPVDLILQALLKN